MILKSLPSSVEPLLRQVVAPVLATSATANSARVVRGPSAAAALQKLMEGNARFALGTSQAFRTAKSEATYAAVVSCSDCKTSAEMIFDAMPGSLFVLQNAGNIYSAESSLLGSLEFCTSKLNVSVILVLGHSNCEAICSCASHWTSTSTAQEAGLSAVFHRTREELSPSDPNMLAKHAIRVNIFYTMERLLSNSKPLRELVREGNLELQGGLFDQESGCVEFLGHLPNLEEHLSDPTPDGQLGSPETEQLSAEAALKLLQEGNQRWVNGTAVASRIPKTISAGICDSPNCAVIGCADLRTPVEQIFDSMPGEIFVLRNAGNTVTHAKGSVVTSLEHCTCKLMTKLILVLGHTSCMAVSSAISHASSAGKASDALLEGIRNVTSGDGHANEISMEEAVELNIYHTINCLLKYSTCIREKVTAGDLKIQGAVYKCATGQVQFLREPQETLKGA